VIIEIIVYEKVVSTVLSYEFLPGCTTAFPYAPSNVRWSYTWPIPFICFDGILLTLTLFKAFSYRDNLNHTIRLLARDSVLYFALMFACLVENIIVVTPAIMVNVIVPAEWIACIAVSRMMLNIRGLKFNDPLGSQGLQFSTLVFQNRNQAELEDDSPNAGTELISRQ